MLAALNEYQSNNTMFPNLKFVIILAGFFPRHPEFQATYTQPISVPTLSIFGVKDYLREDCLKLNEHYKDITVVCISY